MKCELLVLEYCVGSFDCMRPHVVYGGWAGHLAQLGTCQRG